ncbi:MAG: DUF4340 domain-containing protein [Mariprofundaceae bacterium]|nr:DUF4340 domain-containing protein [Mariprofundaceae bacterium]
MALWMAFLVLMGWSAWRFSQPEIAPQAHAPLMAPDIGKIHAIVLASASGTPVRLEQQHGKWMLTGSPDVLANAESVRYLLHDLTAMHVIRVVTHTHAHDAELGMNKGVKLTLLDKADAGLLTLAIGKQGSDLISTYVRIGQSSDVIAVNKVLVWQVRRTRSAWKAPLPKPGNLNKATNALMS